jgi:hypothetical protein
MIETKNYEQLLRDPFDEEDIKWRVQASGIKKDGMPWVRVIPYVTGRAIQQRLDDIFGVFGWENIFQETTGTTKLDKSGKTVNVGKGYLCGIRIKNPSSGEWVTKWDGSEYTNIEGLKGALSGAMKRTGVMLNIGRYLYRFDEEYALCRPVNNRFSLSPGGIYLKAKDNYKKLEIDTEWFKPCLPEWALPSVKVTELIDRINQSTDLITMKGAYLTAYNYAKSFNRNDVLLKITEAKDNMKQKLADQSEKETNQDIQKISTWLERIVTDQLFESANESVLKLAKKNIADQLKEKCIKHDVNIIEFMQRLEKYYQQNLNSLNGAK